MCAINDHDCVQQIVCVRWCSFLNPILTIIAPSVCMYIFCVYLFLIFCAACVLGCLRLLIIYHQLQVVGACSSSHSGWCMLIGRPEAETADLIYKPIQLVLWGIDLPEFPSLKRSPCLYSKWQQVIKVWRGKKTMKVFTIIVLSAITFSDINLLCNFSRDVRKFKTSLYKQHTIKCLFYSLFYRGFAIVQYFVSFQWNRIIQNNISRQTILHLNKKAHAVLEQMEFFQLLSNFRCSIRWVFFKNFQANIAFLYCPWKKIKLSLITWGAFSLCAVNSLSTANTFMC